MVVTRSAFIKLTLLDTLLKEVLCKV